MLVLQAKRIWARKGHRKKQSLAHSGNMPSNISSLAKIGMKTRFVKGHQPFKNFKKNPVMPEIKRLRTSIAYREWRTEIFKRDNYTCQAEGCGARNGNGKTIKLNADHIKPFAHYPELRFELSNGRTLCEPCHRKTDTFGYKATLAYVNKHKD